MTTICQHCGLPAEDHHDFVPQMPDGCICDPWAWFGDPNPVCGTYVGIDCGCAIIDGECVTCAHEKGCHRETKP